VHNERQLLPPDRPLAQFPYTHHVECGVYLQRRPQAEGQQQQQQEEQQQQQPATAAGSGEQPGEDGSRGEKRKAEDEPAA